MSDEKDDKFHDYLETLLFLMVCVVAGILGGTMINALMDRFYFDRSRFHKGDCVVMKVENEFGPPDLHYQRILGVGKKHYLMAIPASNPRTQALLMEEELKSVVNINYEPAAVQDCDRAALE